MLIAAEATAQLTRPGSVQASAAASQIRGLTAQAVSRMVAEGMYEPAVFFIRNQGFVQLTAARQISFADSLVFEQLHEQVYRDLGFRLVEVPAGSLADRVARIQQAVSRPRRAS